MSVEREHLSKIHRVWWQRKRKGCEFRRPGNSPSLTPGVSIFLYVSIIVSRFEVRPRGKEPRTNREGSFVRVQENKSVLSRWLLESEACSIDGLMLPAGSCDSDVGMRLARTLIELSQIMYISIHFPVKSERRKLINFVGLDQRKISIEFRVDYTEKLEDGETIVVSQVGFVLVLFREYLLRYSGRILLVSDSHFARRIPKGLRGIKGSK
ncbi:hypothetical protein V1478_006752, partial [Vespula squamosa]